MRNQSNDLAYISAAVGDLQEYLLSSHLFWPITGKKGVLLTGDTDQLTPGNVLLALFRLKAAALSQEEYQAFTKNQTLLNETIQKWRSNWKRKSEYEFKKRLDLWSDYLQNLFSEPQSHRGDYPFHVRNRFILDLLIDEIGEPEPAVRQLITSQDAHFYRATQKGPFVWEQAIQKAFPEETFPYLYRVVKVPSE